MVNKVLADGVLPVPSIVILSYSNLDENKIDKLLE
jgi:hypothetical protein